MGVSLIIIMYKVTKRPGHHPEVSLNLSFTIVWPGCIGGVMAASSHLWICGGSRLCVQAVVTLPWPFSQPAIRLCQHVPWPISHTATHRTQLQQQTPTRRISALPLSQSSTAKLELFQLFYFVLLYGQLNIVTKEQSRG